MSLKKLFCFTPIAVGELKKEAVMDFVTNSPS